MKISIQEYFIPTRANSPATTLKARIISQDQTALERLPYVFMLPGGPGSNHSFYLAYDCLVDFANIVYYDPRGCGLSDKGDPSTYTMSNYVDDLAFIKQKLLGNQKAYFLGKSFGAMCALVYTLRYPQDVGKLISAAGAPSYQFLEKAKENLLLRGNSEQQQIGEVLWSGAFQNDEHMSQYFRVMASLYSWKIRNQLAINRSISTYPYTFEALNEGFRNRLWKFDVSKQLGQIVCPTLIMVGEEDWITDPSYSFLMADQIPNAQLKVFEKADHFLETDVTELYFETIKSFISASLTDVVK